MFIPCKEQALQQTDVLQVLFLNQCILFYSHELRHTNSSSPPHGPLVKT